MPAAAADQDIVVISVTCTARVSLQYTLHGASHIVLVFKSLILKFIMLSLSLIQRGCVTHKLLSLDIRHSGTRSPDRVSRICITYAKKSHQILYQFFSFQIGDNATAAKRLKSDR